MKAGRFSAGVSRHDPDVAIPNRVPMILQIDRAGLGPFLHGVGGGRVIQFQIVVNFDTVVQDGHASMLHFLPGIVIRGGSVVDVVGLPGQRWEAHIHGRGTDGVNASALVVFSLESERIQNLSFVASLHVATAVASPLSTSEWLEWKPKFQMQFETAE